jgi:hypothetical protein
MEFVRGFTQTRDLIISILEMDILYYISRFYVISVISDNTYVTIANTEDITIKSQLIYYSIINKFVHSDTNICFGVVRFLFGCMENCNKEHLITLLKQRIFEDEALLSELMY